ncbi:MAG: hypothetical protein IK149_03300 [Oscillospiraceae bacterium]|nr:hypothetical protein [Oscillospiraceae bacterium]
MTSFELLRAVSAADDEALLSAESLLGREELSLKKRKTTRIVRTLLIAAVLAALFGVTAVAAGWLTPNPAVSEDSVVYRVERQEDGSVLYVPEEEARHISLTRFQLIPEDLEPAIREKAKNNLAAWEEYRNGAQLLNSELPDEFLPPEGSNSVAMESHDDGGVTLRFYCSIPDGSLPGQQRLELIEARRLTPEQAEEWRHITAQHPLSELLEKYSLKMRGDLRSDHQMKSLDHVRSASEEKGQLSVPESILNDGRYLSNAEIAARTEALFCHAPLFASMPSDFDQVYWFDSGDFCLSFDLVLSNDIPVKCCAYVGRYDVFHTGDEIFCVIPNIPDGISLRCTAADGTELSVLLFGKDAVLYSFLPDAYFCEHVHCDRALTEGDLQQIADFLNCGAIGVN